MDHRQFYIGGAWCDPSQPGDCAVIDPSTEEVCATISLGSAADADRAVAAARAAFEDWSQTPVDTRAALLGKLYDLYLARRADIARAISLEMGAPIDFAAADQFDSGAVHLEETLRVLRDFAFEQARGKDRLLYQPIGVAALITPWNWPMNQVVLKVAPALAAGCTVVLKPSEIAPLSAMLLAELIHQAGFPAGVFNLVNGDGPGVGARLSSHPDVDMVSFTGSTRAGVLISKAAADTIKRVSLELGGKGANIVFEDAPANAVADGVLGCFLNTGQSCDAPTRLVVERACYDEVVEIARAAAEETKVGDPGAEGDHIGPLFDRLQWDRVQERIAKGIAEGARLVAGGPGRPEGLNRGWYARPTVFADVRNDMAIAREEIFGPVLSIISAQDEDEAIAIANDTPYGLAAYVQTGDPVRAERVAKRLRAGAVHLNGGGLGWGTPFGGYKASGNGREGGTLGLEDYQEVKSLHFG